jgi:hypothetical protein
MTAPDRLNWLDPDAVLAWLKEVETYATDAIEIAEDQTDAPSRRVHGRAGARRLLKDAKRSLKDRIAFARRGLSDEEPSA